MEPHEFDGEEQELLESYDRGQWQSSAKLQEEMQQYQSYAAATMRANRLLTIHFSAEDFEGIEQRAVEEGTPYHTFYCEYPTSISCRSSCQTSIIHFLRNLRIFTGTSAANRIGAVQSVCL